MVTYSCIMDVISFLSLRTLNKIIFLKFSLVFCIISIFSRVIGSVFLTLCLILVLFLSSTGFSQISDDAALAIHIYE